MEPEIEEFRKGDVIDPYGELSEKQEAFLALPNKYGMMGGSKGGGKSYGCRAKAFGSSTIRGKMKGLVLRRSRDEVKKNFVEPMLEEVNSCVVNEDGEEPKKFLNHIDSKNVIWFPNGSRIDIGYCETKRDVSRYQGLEYDWICIEELTQWRYEEWRKVMNSLRTTKPGIRPHFFGSCNPGDVGHAWVKRLFITQRFEENEDPTEYGMVRANVYDNPVLLEKDPSYLQNLMNLPEKDRRAYLYGDWDVFEGQFFSEYRESLHVSEYFYPLNASKRIIAIDYGHKNPACALWMALLSDGQVVVYRELYGAGMNYETLALRIKAMTKQGEKIDHIVVDPAQINKETEDTSTTIKKEFQKKGLTPMIPGINDRVEGWRTVRAFLTERNEPNTGEKFSMITITRNCLKLIETFPDQIHDDRNPEDMDSTGDDHALDALRYGLMSLGVNIGSMADVERLNRTLSKESSLSAEETSKARNDALKEALQKPRDRDRLENSRSILDKEF